MASELKLEINSNMVEVQPGVKLGSSTFLVTPPIDEDYWLARVPVSESQAIVCFPKFGTIGIGFQIEEDWNTNLPWTEDANRIFRHIDHNKGNDEIADSDCIKAIQIIQEWIKRTSEA